MFKEVLEGKAKISIPVEKKISRKLPVFYNPIMSFNRDMSVYVLNALNNKDMQIALPLAGTGVRAVRFFKELKKGIIRSVYINDTSENAVKLIKNNLKNNNVRSKFEISNSDANIFLVNGLGFDYIDIDPFGSPNHFLSNSIMRLSRNGILAVTATDTSALCGTYTNACKRKYWAIPLRNELMHEVGLRILIRKVQLIGADFEKALTPVLSYSKDHYMRIFFKCEKGKTKVDKIIKQHSMFEKAGPLWAGTINDKKLLKKIIKNLPENYPEKKFIQLLHDELDVVGFYDIHVLAKKYKISPLLKIEKIIKAIKRNYKVTRTHFSQTGLKTNAKEGEIVKCMK